MDWRAIILRQPLPPEIFARLRAYYYEHLAGNPQFVSELQQLWSELDCATRFQPLHQWLQQHSEPQPVKVYHPEGVIPAQEALGKVRLLVEEPAVLAFATRWRLPHSKRGGFPAEWGAIERWALWQYWNKGLADLAWSLALAPTPPDHLRLSPADDPESPLSLLVSTPPVEAWLQHILMGKDDPAQAIPQPPTMVLPVFMPYESLSEYSERVARQASSLAKEYAEQMRRYYEYYGIPLQYDSRASKLRDDEYLKRLALQVYLRVIRGWTWGQIALLLKELDRSKVRKSTQHAIALLEL